MNFTYLKKTAILFSLITILALFTITGCNHNNKRPDHKNDAAQQQTSATQQRFNDIEKWVRIFEDPERDAWQQPGKVVETMQLRAGDVVADIGAGTGYFTRRFAVAVGPNGKALGLDIEQSMTDYMNEDAKKLGLDNYEGRVVGTDDPELAQDSLDVIFLCNTYHHIENRTVYFRNVAKSLKMNGRIVIVDFYKNTDFGPPRNHKLAKEVVLKEMELAGYKLLKDLKVLTEQYYLEYTL